MRPEARQARRGSAPPDPSSTKAHGAALAVLRAAPTPAAPETLRTTPARSESRSRAAGSAGTRACQTRHRTGTTTCSASACTSWRWVREHVLRSGSAVHAPGARQRGVANCAVHLCVVHVSVCAHALVCVSVFVCLCLSVRVSVLCLYLCLCMLCVRALSLARTLSFSRCIALLGACCGLTCGAPCVCEATVHDRAGARAVVRHLDHVPEWGRHFRPQESGTPDPR